MIRHVVLLVSVCGAVAALAGHAHQRQTAQDPSQQPSFRAGVDAVLLSVTVTDGESRLVTGITKEEFVVYEDGVQQEINFFTRTQVPIALAILIDTSGSMDEKMSTAQEAAIGFVRRLRPEDRAEIIDFDSGPTSDRSSRTTSTPWSSPSCRRRRAARRRSTWRFTSR